MTLTGRVALVATVAVLGCLALMAAVVYSLEARELRGRVDDDLTGQASLIASRLLTTGEVDEVLRGGALQVVTTYAQVVGENGETIPLSTARALLPVDDRVRAVAAGRADRFFSDVEIEGSDVRVLTVPIASGALQVARQVDDVNLHLVRVAGLIAATGLLGVVLALVVGRLVARAALRPVRRLAAEAESIAVARDFDARLAVTADDELSRLAASVNSLLGALDDSLRKQRQLVADASHELKTPLTGLRTELDMLARRGDLPDAERARAAVTDLIGTVDDLLELAREDGPAEALDEVALDEVVRECLAWSEHHHHRDGEVEAELEPFAVDAVRSQVARAVGNIVDNALKFSPPGRPVEVRLRGGVLRVRDHGPGFAPADLPHVFDRFYRAPSARAVPGAGLGLAIVRKVADMHGWSVRAENDADGGAVVVLDASPADSSASPTRGSRKSQVLVVDREHPATRLG
jgi:two-component system, OmpR family, sensor histidine kinase MprB